MLTFVVSLIIGVSVLLVLVILAQNSKGGGLSSQFGGSGASQVIGVKKTTDFLEKATWGLAIALMALTLSTSFIIPKDQEATGISSPNIEQAEQTPVLPSFDANELEQSNDGTEETSGEGSENLDNLLQDEGEE
ncbi:MAG: preprotein translocase subunit SecG [Bacteroidota bacterium]